MPSRKRIKKSRMRGSGTHGGGDKKKRRSAGHRGGHGRAGAGKKGDAKRPSYWHLGRKQGGGFISKNVVETNAINICDVNLMIEGNKFEKKGNVFDVNLKNSGFTKLLSKGSAKYAMNVTVDAATEKAVQKIAKAGGSIAKKE